MVTRSSSAVEARRKAAQRVQEQMQATMNAITEAVVKGVTSREVREEAQRAVDMADAEFRGSVDDLTKLGKSLEEIAVLMDVPLTEIRAARRPKGRPDPEPATTQIPAQPGPAPAAGPQTQLLPRVVPPPAGQEAAS